MKNLAARPWTTKRSIFGPTRLWTTKRSIFGPARPWTAKRSIFGRKTNSQWESYWFVLASFSIPSGVCGAKHRKNRKNRKNKGKKRSGHGRREKIKGKVSRQGDQ